MLYVSYIYRYNQFLNQDYIGCIIVESTMFVYT